MHETGEIERLVKKEQLMIDREIKRLLVYLGGIRHMNGLPTMVFIVDVLREDTAVHEANLRNVPIVAMVDTNCNPENVDYVIPANDDAIRAIKLVISKIADAVLEGQAMHKEEDTVTAERDIIGEDEGRTRVRGRIQIEEEIGDEELLGAATLQKLAESKRELEAEEVAEGESAVEVVEDESPFAVLKAVKDIVATEEKIEETEETVETVETAETAETAETVETVEEVIEDDEDDEEE